MKIQSKYFLFVSASLLAMTTAASASDLIDPAPAGTWTGFHAGVQGGLVSSDISTGAYSLRTGVESTANFDFTAGDATQVVTGFNAGYNYQVRDIVMGIEADVNLKSGHGFYAPFNLAIDSNWDASLRAKAGFLVTPSTLLYATGGLAATSFSTSPADSGTPIGGADPLLGPDLGSSRIGWTIGAGTEYAIDPNWSAKLEYRHTGYGSVSAGSGYPEVNLNDDRVMFGLNYNASSLPVPASSEPAAYDWTGLYVGAQVGAVSADMSVSTVSNVGDYKGPYSAKSSFFESFAGLHAGYNFAASDRIVVGLEGDINAKWGAGTIGLPTVKARPQSDYDGSVRVRAGYLIGPETLAYVTGGFAFGNFTTPFHEAENTGDVSDLLGGMRYGWTAGGGIEQQLDSNWSARIEARYTDWGTKEANWGGDNKNATGPSRLSDVRVAYGMSYKLGGHAQELPRDAVTPDWNGLYAGVQIGSSSAKNQFGYTNGNEEFADFTTPFAGVSLGYNYMLANVFIVGLEGDVNHKFGHGFGIDDVLRYGSSWDASLRGRAGVLVTPRSLIYATGGYAIGNFESPSSGADCCIPKDYLDEHIGGSRQGWTYGGGIEYALDQSIKTRIEYRHTDWDSKIVNTSGGFDVNPSYLSDNRVSLGMTFNLSSLGAN